MYMEFNPDGTLNVTKAPKRDHITVFNLIEELDFPVGKNLLVQILRGEENQRILRHNLDRKVYHGSLGGYDQDQLQMFLNYLISEEFLKVKLENGKFQVIIRTKKAEQEQIDRELSFTVDGIVSTPKRRRLPKTIITDEDKDLFKALDFFLGRFTDEQKKAITDKSSHQLCIAGAGSGKTSVLTHKIVYLVKFAGVKPLDILAITFTRKARKEMTERLNELMPGINIRIETFNSFAEKELLRNGHKLYGKDKQMVDSKQFLQLVTKSLTELGFTFDTFLDQYFTSRERRGKDRRQLFFSFIYDFTSIMDAYIREGKNKSIFAKKIILAKMSDRMVATSILELIVSVAQKLEDLGLRTFGDQLLDVKSLYDKYPEVKKTFPWVLVDEYQDVNSEQVDLLEMIAPNNIFVVGDPRQSIYAWRGAEPERIFDFVKEGTQVLQLTTNFRSSKSVVNFSNKILGEDLYEPAVAFSENEGIVSLSRYVSEVAEAQAIVTEIKALTLPRKEIFVLSRTNKGLEKVREACDKAGIKYMLRTDEQKKLSADPSDEQITLSTVHAIKGLEATLVYVIGLTGLNYPCKAKDHRFVELFASPKSYNQLEEERRLLYVACTRPKMILRMTFAGSLCPFISSHVEKAITENDSGNGVSGEPNLDKQTKALRRWRYLEAKDRGIASYQVFTDKVLDALLDAQPLTFSELEKVQGMSRTRLKEFGNDMLTILNSNR